MSVTDRAFIKAFGQDVPGLVPAAPHFDVARALALSDEARPRTALDLVGAGRRPLSTFLDIASQSIEEQIDLDRSAEQSLDRDFDAADGESLSAAKGFQPAMEVSEFLFDAACEGLLDRAAEALDGAAVRLAALAADHRKVIAVGGLRRGEGRTTVLLCLAKLLAERGLNVAVADADFGHPTLGPRLGIFVERGWESVLSRALPLSEVTIASRSERITLLPLVGPIDAAEKLASGLAASVSLGVLRQNYDIVLMDVGPMLEDGATATALLGRTGANGLLLVCDARSHSGDDVAEAARRMEEIGVPILGLAENFIQPEGHIRRRPVLAAAG